MFIILICKWENKSFFEGFSLHFIIVLCEKEYVSVLFAFSFIRGVISKIFTWAVVTSSCFHYLQSESSTTGFNYRTILLLNLLLTLSKSFSLFNIFEGEGDKDLYLFQGYLLVSEFNELNLNSNSVSHSKLQFITAPYLGRTGVAILFIAY